MSNQRLPDFLIIGGMKCGSTSLFEHLKDHPDLSPCKLKEPAFFCDKRWHKGLDWYQSLFDDTDKLKYEASTNYTKYPRWKSVPERINSIAPDVKLIYIIRHPLTRLLSQVHFNILQGRLSLKEYEDKDFWKKLGATYIDISRYYSQVERYLPYFDRDRMLILQMEKMSGAPRENLKKISNFLGIDASYYDTFDFTHHNSSEERIRMRFKPVHRAIKKLNQYGLFPPLHKHMSEEIPRPTFSDEIIDYLWSQVEDDLAKMEEFMGLELGYSPDKLRASSKTQQV